MAKKFISLLCLISFLAVSTGCSTKADNVSGTYVSPLQYQSYNCNQIRQELTRVNRRVMEVAGKQDSAAAKDAVALGVGLVIFWPALFFMVGGDRKEELSRLKGEYEAIEVAAIEKECDVAAEIELAQKERKEEEARKKEEVDKHFKETTQRDGSPYATY